LTTLVRISLACAALALAAAASGTLAPAAGPGLAYDSVTRFQPAGQGSAPAPPGDFQADFQTASNPPSSSSHAPFGLGKMIAAAQNAAAMFKTGIAERHYVGTTKQRIDNVGLGTADITDCAGRTLTHMDLKAKTYSVTSLDQPQASPAQSHNAPAPGPAATDDGTKVALALTTRSLGAMKIENIATNGYDVNMKVTTTKPSGETSTFDSAMTAYYAAIPEPHLGCPEPHVTQAGPGAGAMTSYAQMMRALRAQKGDPRFTVSSSGPPLPAGNLAMWQLVSLNGGNDARGGGSFQIEMERGDVHGIADSDPVFSVPADFTKV
jgi:hypothetical protein